MRAEALDAGHMLAAFVERSPPSFQELRDAWQRVYMCQWGAILQARQDRSGPGNWAVFKVEMTAKGVAHFVAKGELRRQSEGCWRLWRELVPECRDEQGQLLYKCTVELAHEPQ